MSAVKLPESLPFLLLQSGALHGTLPLTLPCMSSRLPVVVIVAQANGVTLYKVQQTDGSCTAKWHIDTVDKWVLAVGVTIQDSHGKFQVVCGTLPVACIVAQRFPNPHPERTVVDHCNWNTCNDTSANLHWVMPGFNFFNRTKADNTQNKVYKGVWQWSKYRPSLLMW